MNEEAPKKDEFESTQSQKDDQLRAGEESTEEQHIKEGSDEPLVSAENLALIFSI